MIIVIDLVYFLFFLLWLLRLPSTPRFLANLTPSGATLSVCLWLPVVFVAALKFAGLI
jgi:hypothetical protein